MQGLKSFDAILIIATLINLVGVLVYFLQGLRDRFFRKAWSWKQFTIAQLLKFTALLAILVTFTRAQAPDLASFPSISDVWFNADGSRLLIATNNTVYGAGGFIERTIFSHEVSNGRPVGPVFRESLKMSQHSKMPSYNRGRNSFVTFDDRSNKLQEFPVRDGVCFPPETKLFQEYDPNARNVKVFSKSGRLVADSNGQNRIQVREVPSGKIVWESPEGVRCSQGRPGFTADESTLVFSDGFSVYVASIDDGTVVKSKTGRYRVGYNDDIYVLPNKTFLAAAKDRVQRFDFDGGRLPMSLPADLWMGSSISDDGTKLAFRCDFKIQIFELKQYKVTHTFDDPARVRPFFQGPIEFSPDGKSLAIGHDRSNRVWLIDAETGEQKWTMEVPSLAKIDPVPWLFKTTRWPVLLFNVWCVLVIWWPWWRAARRTGVESG